MLPIVLFTYLSNMDLQLMFMHWHLNKVKSSRICFNIFDSTSCAWVYKDCTISVHVPLKQFKNGQMPTFGLFFQLQVNKKIFINYQSSFQSSQVFYNKLDKNLLQCLERLYTRKQILGADYFWKTRDTVHFLKIRWIFWIEWNWSFID